MGSIPESEADVRDGLARSIAEWKSDATYVTRLGHLIGRWHGNVWFCDLEAYRKFYSDFSDFKRESIDLIGALTMPQRLHLFGLAELWQNGDENVRATIERKVAGVPALLHDGQYYKEEYFGDLARRYHGYGTTLLLLLRQQLPQVFYKFRFYQATTDTGIYVDDRAYAENSYAVCENGALSFAMQLDPEAVTINIWNDDVEFETGYWDENADLEVLNFIRENFMDRKN